MVSTSKAYNNENIPPKHSSKKQTNLRTLFARQSTEQKTQPLSSCSSVNNSEINSKDSHCPTEINDPVPKASISKRITKTRNSLQKKNGKSDCYVEKTVESIALSDKQKTTLIGSSDNGDEMMEMKESTNNSSKNENVGVEEKNSSLDSDSEFVEKKLFNGNRDVNTVDSKSSNSDDEVDTDEKNKLGEDESSENNESIEFNEDNSEEDSTYNPSGNEGDDEEDKLVDVNEENDNEGYADIVEAENQKEVIRMEEMDVLRSDEEMKEARYNQLLTLLSKSRIYVDIIKRRFAEDIEKKKKKDAIIAARKAKKDEKLENADEEQTMSTQIKPVTRRSRPMKLSAIIPKSSKSVAKRRRVEQENETEESIDVKEEISTPTVSQASTSQTNDQSSTSQTIDQSSISQTIDQEYTITVDAESESGQEGLLLFTGGVLRPYQREGYKWMVTLFENGMNGILGDEMGLGKTVQVISLIAYMLQHGVTGPFLIIAPLSTLPNWMSEFKRFTPLIPVLLYHGPPKTRDTLRYKMTKRYAVELPRGRIVEPPVTGEEAGPEDYTGLKPGVVVHTCSVVVTSYEMITKDWAHLRKIRYKAMVIDEGHRLKNTNCLLIRALRLFHTDLRILLTGTPLQNSLAELWSLLNFLLPDIFYSLASFETWFDPKALMEKDGHERLIAQEQEKAVLAMMHQILAPFLLRRLKSDVDLAVPPKREVIIYARMTPDQQKLYSSVAEKTIEMLMGTAKASTVELDLANILGEGNKRSRPMVNYQELLDDTDLLIDEDDSDTELPKKRVRKRKRPDDEEETTITKTKSATMKMSEMSDSYLAPGSKRELNLNVRSTFCLLRRIVNHPYLIEYPLDADGEYLLNRNLVEMSGKMIVLDKLLTILKEQKRKVLVFSQWTSILDILQDYFNWKQWRYSRLDGGFSLEKRSEQIRWFMEDPSIFAFLLTARAGGLGLNLVAADTVIIFDSDWNPQTDIQAQDRCHRIGQVNPVLVFRLVTADTADQRIIDRAFAKRKLEKLIIPQSKFKRSVAHETTDLSADQTGSCSKNGASGLRGMSRSDLLELLSQKDYEKQVDQNWLTDDMAVDILDRSDLSKKWKAQKDGNTVQDTSFDCKKAKKLAGVARVLDSSECHQLGSFLDE